RATFKPRVTRFLSSGGSVFSHTTRGTTPNMAPPSSANAPSERTWTLMSPRVTIRRVFILCRPAGGGNAPSPPAHERPPAVDAGRLRAHAGAHHAHAQRRAHLAG